MSKGELAPRDDGDARKRPISGVRALESAFACLDLCIARGKLQLLRLSGGAPLRISVRYAVFADVIMSKYRCSNATLDHKIATALLRGQTRFRLSLKQVQISRRSNLL